MEARLAGADRPRGGEESLGLHRGEGLAGAREAPVGSSNQQEVMRVRRGSANRRVNDFIDLLYREVKNGWYVVG